MRYSIDEANKMLQDEFSDAPYVINDLLGNAGFKMKVTNFVCAYINEGKPKSECSTALRAKGIVKSGIMEVLGLLSDLYKKEPLLNK